MKKLLLFLTTLLLLANVKWAKADDKIDIGLYATSCSEFEVRVSSQTTITGTSLTNVQFAVKYPASATLGDITSSYPVALQYTTTVGSDKYSVFIGVDVPINNWVIGTEYTILKFSIDHAASSSITLVIGNDTWTTNNNAMYYAELLGINKTGAILAGATVNLRVHNTDLDRYYCKIQEAMDDAGTNNTIVLVGGNYPENVNINRPITLRGPYYNIDPCSGSRPAEAVITSTDPTGTLKISANNVTIEGIKITGGTYGILAMDDYSGLKIRYNLIDGPTSDGINLWTSTGGQVNHNKIMNCPQVGIGGGSDDASAPTNAIIENNCITNTRYGITGYHNGSAINQNIISGFALAPPAAGISGQLLSTPIGNNEIFGYTYAPGIALTAYGSRPNSANVSITDNSIYDNGAGIYFDATQTLIAVVANHNKIYHNPLDGASGNGVLNLCSSSFNAENNWWGFASGPYNTPYNTCGEGNAVIGKVDFMPWWTTSTGVDGSGTLAVNNSTIGTWYCKIQDAIDDPATNDLVGDHDVITVAAGNYNENVRVTKAISLIGPNQGIDPNTGSRGSEAIITTDDLTTNNAVSIRSSDVTIDGFTMYGPNGTIKDIGAIELTPYGPRTNVHIQYNKVYRTLGGSDWNCDGIRIVPPSDADASIYVEHNLISVGGSGGEFPKGNNDVTLADNGYKTVNAGSWVVGSPDRFIIKNNVLSGHGKLYIEGIGVLVESNTFNGNWGPIESRGVKDMVINKNIMSGTVDVGIFAWSPAPGASGAGLSSDLIITNNTINATKLDAPELVQNFSDKGTGILLGGITNATVTNNFVTNNLGQGVVIGGIGYQHFDPSWGLPGVAFDPVNNVINNNDLSGNVGYDLHNYTTTLIDATCNWYGTVGAGAIAAKISGSFTWSPYLVLGTDDEPGTPGFQPVTGSCSTVTDLYVNDDVYTSGTERWTLAVGNDANPGDGSVTVQDDQSCNFCSRHRQYDLGGCRDLY